VIEKLNEFVEPKKFGFGKKYSKEYEGSVNTDSFDISRSSITEILFSPDKR
jgi:hypothetical protein